MHRCMDSSKRGLRDTGFVTEFVDFSKSVTETVAEILRHRST